MNPMDQQKIGTFLKQLRQERQLTQETLAEIMCVTNRSVSRWENGVSQS
jgi:transcriptional regulator with XRE-family HTH domain